MIKNCDNCMYDGGSIQCSGCRCYNHWKLKTIQDIYPELHKVIYTDTDSIKVEPEVKCIFSRDQLVPLFQWMFNIAEPEAKYLVDLQIKFVRAFQALEVDEND